MITDETELRVKVNTLSNEKVNSKDEHVVF